MRTFRIGALALAAGLMTQSGAALALEAHEELEAELAAGEVKEIETGGVTARMVMPCTGSDTSDGMVEPEGLRTMLCMDGDVMFLFVSSVNVGPDHPSALTSDFDETYRQVEESEDTVAIEMGELDGRRAMSAERGPGAKFGLMRAIEIAPDRTVFAIAMAGDRNEPLSAAVQQEMRNFVASLEIVE